MPWQMRSATFRTSAKKIGLLRGKSGFAEY
jgi:hypothetical protein